LWCGQKALGLSTKPLKPPSASSPFRSLITLEKSGSTTRVLNLSAIAARHGKTPEYAQAPFFAASMLNRALVVKHRLRSDDVDLEDGGRRGTVTKVIIPFDPNDLASGGASFLVGQLGWQDVVQELCDGLPSFLHDKLVLECLQEIPSFDPFLLREYLRRRELRPADCYFAIAEGDRERMARFVEREITGLIEMAYAGRRIAPGSCAKLVEILLASDTDERLEPLRIVLRLEGDSYRAGIFAWKGFLYYKWASETLLAQLRPVIAELTRLEISDRTNPEVNAFVEGARMRLQRLVQQRLIEVGRGLELYDEAFAALTQRGEAVAFREFLLNSPERFLALGERIGAIAHIVSYWRYRFPTGGGLRASAEEVINLFDDFESGLAHPELELAA